ncbi:MAG: hypothetical protein ABSB19_00435 [Methylomonas sp.]|jgi:uncharacterized coiled-coil protein SlyX
MPLVSIEALLRTLAEQQDEITELREQVTELEYRLENHNTEMLTQELEKMLDGHANQTGGSIIASIEMH